MVWANDNRYEILGTRFRVQAEDEAAGDEIRRLLHEFVIDRQVPVRPRFTYSLVTAASKGGPHPRLYRDCGGLATGVWSELHNRLLADLNRNAVEHYKGFAVHSGVVGLGGRAVAFPAGSAEGKSTLTAAAVMAGFEYVSDESLCLDLDTATVVPYPKPILLSDDSFRRLDLGKPIDRGPSERPVLSEELGGATHPDGLELTDVVFSEYGYEDADLAPLPPSEVVAGLLRLSFNHYKQPAESYRIVNQVAGSARGWRLTYGDPSLAAGLLLKQFMSVSG